MRVGEQRDIAWEESATVTFSVQPGSTSVDITRPDGTVSAQGIDQVSPVEGTLALSHKFKELTNLDQGGIWLWEWKYTNNNDEDIHRPDYRVVTFNDAQQIARQISGLQIQDRQLNPFMVYILKEWMSIYDCIEPYNSLSAGDAYYVDFALANMVLAKYAYHNPTLFINSGVKSVSEAGLRYEFALPNDAAPARDLINNYIGAASKALLNLDCVESASTSLPLFAMAGPRQGAREAAGVYGSLAKSMTKLLMEAQEWKWCGYVPY